MLGLGVPVLENATVLETRLEELDPDGTGDRCLARIEHRDLPVEWTAPMRDYWQLHLTVISSWERLNTVDAHGRHETLLKTLQPTTGRAPWCGRTLADSDVVRSVVKDSVIPQCAPHR